jgi:hypothetical protein
MTQKRGTASGSTYLQIKGEQLKVEIQNYNLVFENAAMAGSGMGAAPGIMKIASLEVAVDEKNAELLKHLLGKNKSTLPYEGKFEQVSIVKNSKKAFDFFDCYINIWKLLANTGKNTGGTASMQFEKITVFQ